MLILIAEYKQSTPRLWRRVKITQLPSLSRWFQSKWCLFGGLFFLCLFSWQRCREGQKACWDVSVTTCLQIILIHVMMRWESEGDHRSGNGKDQRPDWIIPCQPLHPSWQDRVPRQKMDRPVSAKYPGCLETLTIWQQFELEPWDASKTLWAEEEGWVHVLLGRLTSALVFVLWQVTSCKSQENPFCPFSRPATPPLF